MRSFMNFSTIPLSQVPLPGSRETQDGPRPVILVVDDEHLIADTLTQILMRSGYRAMAAYGATKAIELAELTPPDLLITDVAMPGMSGVDLAIAMRNTVPDCEIILFSGQASTLDLLASARAAGHSFTALSKPLHPTLMLQHVADTLDGRNAN